MVRHLGEPPETAHVQKKRRRTGAKPRLEAQLSGVLQVGPEGRGVALAPATGCYLLRRVPLRVGFFPWKESHGWRVLHLLMPPDAETPRRGPTAAPEPTATLPGWWTPGVGRAGKAKHRSRVDSCDSSMSSKTTFFGGPGATNGFFSDTLVQSQITRRGEVLLLLDLLVLFLHPGIATCQRANCWNNSQGGTDAFQLGLPRPVRVPRPALRPVPAFLVLASNPDQGSEERRKYMSMWPIAWLGFGQFSDNSCGPGVPNRPTCPAALPRLHENSQRTLRLQVITSTLLHAAVGVQRGVPGQPAPNDSRPRALGARLALTPGLAVPVRLSFCELFTWRLSQYLRCKHPNPRTKASWRSKGSSGILGANKELGLGLLSWGNDLVPCTETISAGGETTQATASCSARSL